MEITPSQICCGIIIVSIMAIMIIGILIGFGYKKWKDRTKPVHDHHTRETFLVQNNKDEPEWVGQEVAKRLGKLTQNGDLLIEYFVKEQLPHSKRLAKRWRRIRKNPRGIRETGSVEQPAAYTVNKSEQMRICIRKPGSQGELEDLNTSMLVLLHEMAHMMSHSYGHGQEFRTNFALITNVAVRLGLYNYVDYSKNPTSYCNTKITHSPYIA